MQSAKLVDIARRSYVAARVELTTLELEKGEGSWIVTVGVVKDLM